MQTLSAEHLDFLKEMFNIGGGNAAGVLSQMFECRTDVVIPEIIFVGSSQVSSVLDGAKTVALVRMKLYGDINGSLLFVIQESQRAYLVNLISKTEVGREVPTNYIKDLAEWGNSVIEEFSNILASAYLDSINRFCKLDIHYSVPRTENDTTAGALEKTIRETGLDNGLIIIKNRFVFMETPVEAFFMIVLNNEFIAGLAGAINDSRREMRTGARVK